MFASISLIIAHSLAIDDVSTTPYGTWGTVRCQLQLMLCVNRLVLFRFLCS
jgi:hypothetical protein